MPPLAARGAPGNAAMAAPPPLACCVLHRYPGASPGRCQGLVEDLPLSAISQPVVYLQA